MSQQDRERWNAKHAQCQAPTEVRPDEWLVEACRHIEAEGGAAPGRALDLACGLGHNAIWLAEQGWRVDAVDISAAGLRLARQAARRRGVEVQWIEADLDDWTPPSQAYDLVLVFRFLDRQSAPRIVAAGLQEGGWLVYETFSRAQCERQDSHIHNPAFTLAAGELPRLFPFLVPAEHREDVLANRTVERFLGRRQQGS